MRAFRVRNKYAIKELLQGGAHFEKLSIAKGLQRDELTHEIVALARERSIRVEETPIRDMSKRRGGETHEVVLGHLLADNVTSLKKLLDELNAHNKDPFLLLINRVDFENNIGAIARTAFAAGVNGLLFQGDEERFLNEDTLHFSLGAIMRIPLVKISIFEALKEFSKNGIKSYCLSMDGAPYSKEDLTGPAAFVLGAEHDGLSRDVISRCDSVILIPMREGIDSLNVAVSAGIVLYEKVRQELVK